MSIGQSQAGRKRGRRAVGQICGRDGEISLATGGAVRPRHSGRAGTASVFRFPEALAVWRSAPVPPRRTDAEGRKGRGVAEQAPPGRQCPTWVCDNLDALRKGPLLKASESQAARRRGRRFGCRSTLQPGKWLNLAKSKWNAMACEGLGGRRDGESGAVPEEIRAGRRRRTVANGHWPGRRRRSLQAQVGLPRNHLATRRWADPAQSTHQRAGLPIRALRGPNHRQVVLGPLVRSRESGHRNVARTHLAWLRWRWLKTCYYRKEGRVAGWPPLKAAALPFDWGHRGNSRRRSFRLVRCREWRFQAKVGAGTRDRRGSTHGIELPPGKLSASSGSGGELKPWNGLEEVAPNGACHAVRRATRERTRFGGRSRTARHWSKPIRAALGAWARVGQAPPRPVLNAFGALLDRFPARTESGNLFRRTARESGLGGARGASTGARPSPPRPRRVVPRPPAWPAGGFARE